ncbi:hypothetical protein ACN47E_003034 [Coniothyrium glycines]
MEPPPKRLRILQSVEVDEENPDYIKAKQKQQYKFKGRLEDIFAKYENMHESMSDEIDMRTNEVVVDRGHIRRLVRQVNRQETMLLDTLGLDAEKPGAGTEESDQEDREESEDELAPTQQPSASSGHKRKRQLSMTEGNGQEPDFDDDISKFQQADTPNNALQRITSQIPEPIDPAANLLQLVPFPQTPAGQQAQTTFYATLTQTINQAVQQAVAPLLQGMLPKTPNVRLPFFQAPAAPATPAMPSISDNVTPASDPKWFFPPLKSNTKDSLPNPRTIRLKSATCATVNVPIRSSSVLVNPKRKRNKKNGSTATSVSSIQKTNVKPLMFQPTSTASNSACEPCIELHGEIEIATPRQSSPRVVIRRKMGPSKTFKFTQEDDIYISKRKELYNESWVKIRIGRRGLRDVSPENIRVRWEQHIKGKKLFNQDSHTSEDYFQLAMYVDPALCVSSSRHLPTPSSSEYEDTNKEADELAAGHGCVIAATSSHYDEDERDLLSIAGDEVNMVQSPEISAEEERLYPHPDEDVLPSIEQEPLLNEEVAPQHPPRGSTPAQPATTYQVKAELPLSSPTTKRKRKPAPAHRSPVPDTEGEQDSDNLSSQPLPQPHPPRAPSPRHQSLDLIAPADDDDDDDLTPTTTTTPIKLEHSSPPPPSSLLFTTPQAPRAQHPPSSGPNSTTQAHRKAYLQRIKQSWARCSTPASKSGAKKRSAFVPAPGAMAAEASRSGGANRQVEEADESEDELAR